MTDRRKSISQMITSVFQKPDKDVMADESVAVPEEEPPVRKSSLNAAARSHVRYDTQNPLATKTEGVKSYQPEHVRSMLNFDETAKGRDDAKDTGCGPTLPKRAVDDAAKREGATKSRGGVSTTHSGKGSGTSSEARQGTTCVEKDMSGNKAPEWRASREDMSGSDHSTTHHEQEHGASIHIPGQWDTLKGEELLAQDSSTTRSTRLPVEGRLSEKSQQGNGRESLRESDMKGKAEQEGHNIAPALETVHADTRAVSSRSALYEANTEPRGRMREGHDKSPALESTKDVRSREFDGPDRHDETRPQDDDVDAKLAVKSGDTGRDIQLDSGKETEYSSGQSTRESGNAGREFNQQSGKEIEFTTGKDGKDEAFESVATVAQQVRRQSVEKVAPPLHQMESARNAKLKGEVDANVAREHEHCQLAHSYDTHHCEVEEKELARRISAGYDHVDLSLGKDATVSSAGASTDSSFQQTRVSDTEKEGTAVVDSSSISDSTRRKSDGKAQQFGDKIREKVSKASGHSDGRDVQIDEKYVADGGVRRTSSTSDNGRRGSGGKVKQLGDKILGKASKAVGHSGEVQDGEHEKDRGVTNVSSTSESARRGSDGKSKQLGDKIREKAATTSGHTVQRDEQLSEKNEVDRGMTETSSAYDSTRHGAEVKEGKAKQLKDKPLGKASKALGQSGDSHEGQHHGLQKEADRDVFLLKDPPAGVKSLGPASDVSEVSGPTSPSTLHKHDFEDRDRAPPLGNPTSSTVRGRSHEVRSSSVDHSEAGIGAVVTGIAGAAGSAHSSEAGKDHHHVKSQQQHSASSPTSPITEAVHYKQEDINDKTHVSKERRKSGGGFALARSKFDDKRKEKSYEKDLKEKEFSLDKHLDKKVPLGQKIKSFIKGDKPVSSEHTASGNVSDAAVDAAGAAFAKPHVSDTSSPAGIAADAGGHVHEGSGIASSKHPASQNLAAMATSKHTGPKELDTHSGAGASSGKGHSHDAVPIPSHQHGAATARCVKEVEYAHHQGVIQSPPSAHNVGKFSFEQR